MSENTSGSSRGYILPIRVLTGLLVLLVCANMYLYMSTKDARRALESQNRVIQQGRSLEPIYRQLIQRLAQGAAAKQDNDLKSILTTQGIEVSVNKKSPAN